MRGAVVFTCARTEITMTHTCAVMNELRGPNSADRLNLRHGAPRGGGDRRITHSAALGGAPRAPAAAPARLALRGRGAPPRAPAAAWRGNEPAPPRGGGKAAPLATPSSPPALSTAPSTIQTGPHSPRPTPPTRRVGGSCLPSFPPGRSRSRPSSVLAPAGREGARRVSCRAASRQSRRKSRSRWPTSRRRTDATLSRTTRSSCTRRGGTRRSRR
mmetsp:Transcript_20712/g.70085  ORF Transcript_20712/g.70085 Transcript_20712/m.70085 type:complete len:215 (-) Transcript_20712:198-842(-)